MADGIINGFQLVDPNTQFTEVNMRNYKSATNATFKLLVEKTIRNEIQQGNYVITATIPTVESASGVIPKPNSSEARLIHDCFRRHGHAVNEFISTRYVKFQFLYDAIKLLKPNYFMAKIDLNHAYRWRPIYSANNQATGCQWRFSGNDFDNCFYDTRLPFGAESSPEIFHRPTQAVRRMVGKRGFVNMIVYLDNFHVIGATRSAPIPMKS